MTANRATDDSADDGRAALGRESGIVKIVEREASPVTGAEEPEKGRKDGIDVDADFDDVEVKTPSAATPARSVDVAVSDEIVLDDDSIEVADDEIETADALLARPTQPSPAEPSPKQSPPAQAPTSSSLGVIRSRPPVRPSARPRTPSTSSALPPPRSAPWVAPGHPASGPAGSSPPSGADPWLLANKTLELRHAHARITELEELVAFRDARVTELEEKLEKAQQKLDELERKLSPRAADLTKAAQAVKGGSGDRASVSKPAAVHTSTAQREQPQAMPIESTERVATMPAIAAKSVVEVRPEPQASTSATPADAGAVGRNGDEGGHDSSGRAPANAGLAPTTASEAWDGERDDLDAHDEDLSAYAGDSTAPAPPSGGGEPTEEDLRQISGIGPRFEAALRKHGITRLSQIAAWSDADVRQVAKVLKIPKSRIVKGRWVESAREAIGTRAASE